MRKIKRSAIQCMPDWKCDSCRKVATKPQRVSLSGEHLTKYKSIFKYFQTKPFHFQILCCTLQLVLLSKVLMSFYESPILSIRLFSQRRTLQIPAWLFGDWVKPIYSDTTTCTPNTRDETPKAKLNYWT